MKNVEIGQVWDSVGSHPRVQGRYIVVAPNDSCEAGPDSWQMQRISDGKIGWMHHRARLQGEWLPC